MEYFECSVPTDNGLCSDNACPCPEAVIPRGKGYLYIEQSLVDFRRKYPAIESARRVIQQERKQLQQTLARNSDRQEIIYRYRLGPVLVCEEGAKLRNLDLEVAAADAKHWWETGLVPLRATPIAKEPGLAAVNTETKVTAQTAPQDKDVDNKINMLWDSAKKLGWSKTDCEKKISIYTEVLGLVDKGSKYNACAPLRNRAISYRNLKKFEEALDDLQRELEIAQKIGDKWRIMKCRKAIEQTRKLRQKGEVEAGGAGGQISPVAVPVSTQNEKPEEKKEISVSSSSHDKMKIDKYSSPIVTKWYCVENSSKHVRQIVLQLPPNSEVPPRVTGSLVIGRMAELMKQQWAGIVTFLAGSTEEQRGPFIFAKANNVVQFLNGCETHIAFAFYQFPTGGMLNIFVSVQYPKEKAIETKSFCPFIAENVHWPDGSDSKELIPALLNRDTIEVCFIADRPKRPCHGYFGLRAKIPEDCKEALKKEWNSITSYHTGLSPSQINHAAVMAQFEKENPFEEDPILNAEVTAQISKVPSPAIPSANLADGDGAGKKAKLQAMSQQASKIFRSEPDCDTAFESLFADLEDNDPDVRTEASKLLFLSRNARSKLIKIYYDFLDKNPRKSVLAGRVLGRKMDGGKKDMVHAQTTMIMFGVQIAFTPCVCGYCDKLNVGIPVPESGLGACRRT